MDPGIHRHSAVVVVVVVVDNMNRSYCSSMVPFRPRIRGYGRRPRSSSGIVDLYSIHLVPLTVLVVVVD